MAQATTHKQSKAQELPKNRRGQFLATLRRMREPHVCEYGHYDCSTSEHGPCSNELIGIIETQNGEAE
jgi:hypothetical protein